MTATDGPTTPGQAAALAIPGSARLHVLAKIVIGGCQFHLGYRWPMPTDRETERLPVPFSPNAFSGSAQCPLFWRLDARRSRIG